MLVLHRRIGSSIRIGHEIRVHVRSIKGKSVKLGIDAPPAVRVLRDELAAPHRQSRHVQEVRAGLRVLVVEDDSDHAQLIELALQDCGISKITVLPSGEAAVQMLIHPHREKDQQPQLVLLDLRLPGISGVDVVREIRAASSTRSVPVVILSCCSGDTDVADCLDAGANAFMVKPTEYEAFRDSIGRIADFWTNAHHAA
ncbi:MAG: response regulator [Planctomycetota bacterium]|jgi:carbon storage regulator CsrA